ncbi:IS1182 family transposase [bacterium]|nr:IS1182 family transposase [bacterium]
MVDEVGKVPRVKPINRKQMILCPIDVEKLIDEDHMARSIWEFVSQLDLSAYYNDIEAVEGQPGRSAFDPQLLISLWLYAYSQGIGRAREIARLCDFHPAFQWLTGMQQVNYHTLSDFRILHQEKLDDLFKQALAVLDSEGILDLKRCFQDGSKISASASSSSFHRENKIEDHLKLAEELLSQLQEQSGEQETKKIQAAKQRAAQKRKEALQKALQQFNDLPKKSRSKEPRVSETDPDCRIMKDSNGGYLSAYNAQVSVEGKNGIIVGLHVSQSASDFEQLQPGLQSVQDHAGKTPDEVIVDKGFTSKRNIIDLSEKGIHLIGPIPSKTGSAGQFDRRGIDPGFHADAFLFDVQKNCYVCPAGKELTFTSTKMGKASLEHTYLASRKDCRICQFQKKCCGQTKNPRRSIVRSEDVASVVQFTERMQTDEAQQIYKQRCQLIEFTFAWIKDKLGLRKFHVRGLKKVLTELLWVCLTYNIQQWIRLRRNILKSTA